MINEKILKAMAEAQITRNLNCTALITKANSLEYCKRNILLTKIIFWDRVYSEIVDILINKPENPKRSLNANAACLKYIKDNELANPFFAEFFFNFHEPITLAFLRRLKAQLNNGMPYDKKFQYVANEITDVLNLAFVELQGLDISCEAFGGDPLCPTYRECNIKECNDPANIFFVMMNEEYKMEPGLFEEILAVAMRYLKQAKDKIIMIVDYKNMKQTDYTFGPKARARYDFCMQSVEQVYFYNWKAGMSFGEEFRGLEPYLIPDKKALNNLIATWKTKKELITF